MSVCVLLTISPQVDEQARSRVDASLVRERWTKLHQLAWHKAFGATINEAGALVVAKADMESAARQSGIRVKCWVQICKDLPLQVELG